MLLDIDTEKIAIETANLVFQDLSLKAKSNSHYGGIREDVISELITLMNKHPADVEDTIESVLSNIMAKNVKDKYAPMIELINLMAKVEGQE